jgi:Ca2+-binding RTX toxin-like protein
MGAVPSRRTKYGVLAVLLAAIAGVALVGPAAGAGPGCVGARSLSASGTVLRGGSCSETIVVTSPEVRAVYGGEGDDRIYANPDVTRVYGGPGDDVMYGDLPEAGAPAAIARAAWRRMARSRAGAGGASASANGEVECAPKTAEGKACYGGPGNQIMKGGAGADVIFGQRGNDQLLGEGGNDALFGGIGDDEVVGEKEVGAGIKGGPGNDLLSGGYGKDKLNGEEGSDLVRGDGTTDEIVDSGASGTDTLSYATGVNPGFIGFLGEIEKYEGFPQSEAPSEERGVAVSLGGATVCEGINSAAGIKYQGCNNSARYGGGSDQVNANNFENLIGSAFDDILMGSEDPNRIDGGGGADVVLGEGGNDTLFGGAEGDYLNGGAGTDTADGQAGTNNCAEVEGTPSNCSGSASKVVERNRNLISVGLMVTSFPTNLNWAEVYMLGSNGNDAVNMTYTEGTSPKVTFTATAGTFATEASVQSAGCSYTTSKVECTLSKKPDTILMAGLQGDDQLSMSGFPAEIPLTPSLLGGEGNDTLEGNGQTEDVIVDGDGAFNDFLTGRGFDDALVNNEGADKLEGGNGNDLFVSLGTCEGDTLQGAESGNGDGEDVNNASWAPMLEASGGVTADLAAGTAGNGFGSEPTCPGGGTLDTVKNIDDVEGSNQADKLFGDGNENSLFGHKGADQLFPRAGNDFIEARDGVKDELNGGEGSEDLCKLDEGTDPKSGCEIFVK